MLRELRNSTRKSVFNAPILSLIYPVVTLPIADAILYPATSAAAMLDDSPRDVLYNGRKKGGTKIGKVATAPARKMSAKRDGKD